MKINFLESRCLLAAVTGDETLLNGDSSVLDSQEELSDQAPGFWESFLYNPLTRSAEYIAPAVVGLSLKHFAGIHGGNGLGDAVFSNITAQITTKSIVTYATVPLDEAITEESRWSNFDEYAQDYDFNHPVKLIAQLGMTAVGSTLIHYFVRPIASSFVQSYGSVAVEAVGGTLNGVLPGSGEVVKPVLSGALNVVPWLVAKMTTMAAQKSLFAIAGQFDAHLAA